MPPFLDSMIDGERMAWNIAAAPLRRACMTIAECKDRLVDAGVSFDAGLSDLEIADIERQYEFCFPPDLRDFLAHGLPVSKGWVDWRSGTPADIVKRLEWPFDGLCFDIEHNKFWLESWGPKPATSAESFVIARAAVAAAPRLIPVCGHRYLPDRPCKANNPVFSVYQTDIIYYGIDLVDYFANEFGYYFGRSGYQFTGPVREIEFWSDFVEK